MTTGAKNDEEGRRSQGVRLMPIALITAWDGIEYVITDAHEVEALADGRRLGLARRNRTGPVAKRFHARREPGREL